MRLVTPPADGVQREEWGKILKEEAFNIFQPNMVEVVVQRFFERLAEPQLCQTASVPIGTPSEAGPGTSPRPGGTDGGMAQKKRKRE